MEIAKDIRDFLMTRRAKVTPDQVGLAPGGRRRVTGLRREEVALLAGMSTEYYVQIERGNVAGVSDEILRAIAETLRLNDEETTYLFDLVRAATAGTTQLSSWRGTGGHQVPPGVQALMDAMVTAPAIVVNGHLDILGTNALGRALYADVFDRASEPPNLARFIFLDDRAPELFTEWEQTAEIAVGMLHVEAARSPHSNAVTGLIGELSARSQDFRTRWAAHEVRTHLCGAKRFRHRVVGDLTLRFEAFEIASATGLMLIGYTAEPGSPSHAALQLLASQNSTDQSTTARRVTDPEAHSSSPG